MSLDLLAIGAHPDDVEMTSGGLIALSVKQGKRLGILHLTKGEMGTRGTPEERVQEATRAAEVLGVHELRFAGLIDGELVVNDHAVRCVVDVVRELRPTVVVANYPTCHHPDHEAAAAIVRRALHFSGKLNYKADAAPHNVQALLHARYSHPFEPSFYLDISDVIDVKRKAIECYVSQFLPKAGEPETRLSNPGFLDQLLARSSANGLIAGCMYAEEYRSAGPLVMNDPIAFFASQKPLNALLR